MIADLEDSDHFQTFRDCVSSLLIVQLSRTPQATRTKRGRGRKNEIKPVIQSAPDNGNDAAELGETIDYIATEIFTSLPAEARTITYSDIKDDISLAEKYSLPLETSVYNGLLKQLPPSVEDSLASFGLLKDPEDLPRLLQPVFTEYVEASVAPPPEFTPSCRGTECEICEREHLPLTYHHLIPRAVHAKVLKRNWHAAWELQKVAWLCRACHSFVHRMASNEELARDWYTIELILDRDDVQKWANWVGRIRWKKR